MNKRQKKKRQKEVVDRYNFINSHFIISGRQNGKWIFRETIIKIINSKKYKPFRKLKKEYRKLYLAVDLGNGRDYTAKCYCRFFNGVRQIIKTEFE